jgi:Repeat of unknown function (DUF5648)/Platelet-activating factor acetylhydrolase, isoform II
MNNTRSGMRRALGAAACFLVFILFGSVADAQPIAPFGPGAEAVGCSNIEQDFARLPSGDNPEDYWEGRPRGTAPRYVTDLLLDPVHALLVQQTIPGDSTLYGPYAGTTYPFAAVVCYPTPPTNPRADYVLPSGRVIPHMQRGAETPLYADPNKRYPVLLFSHGLSGSPISEDYIDAVKLLASHGYVVIAAFHGDARFADIELEDFEDALYALLNFKTFVAMQALRPLVLSSMLTAMVEHPDYRDHVDQQNVGGFGASLGGESLLLMGGAALTTSIGQASNRVLQDARVKAAVGYVPYFGIDVYPAFGRDLKGLDGVTLPYLAISGTADTTAPISVAERGMRRLSNTHQLVALQDVKHGFDARFTDDIFSWALAFLNGQLGNDAVARATSARMTAIAGGGDDRLRLDYIAPSPATGDERIAFEYYSNSLAHYFITAEPAEAAMLDAGIIVPGWQRTGYAFKVWEPDAVTGLAACRFYGAPPNGPNSHFFTIDAAECAKVKANPVWAYEGLAFNAEAPAAEACPSNRVPVIRLYNNGMGGQANHRYTTSHSEMAALVNGGWIIEGAVFCGLP